MSSQLDRGRCGVLALALLGSTCGEPRVVGGGPGTEMPPAGGTPTAGSGAPGAAEGPGFTLPPSAPATAIDAGAPPPPPASGTCASEVRQAGRLPVDSLFLVDKSQSMTLEIGAARPSGIRCGRG